MHPLGEIWKNSGRMDIHRRSLQANHLRQVPHQEFVLSPQLLVYNEPIHTKAINFLHRFVTKITPKPPKIKSR